MITSRTPEGSRGSRVDSMGRAGQGLKRLPSETNCIICGLTCDEERGRGRGRGTKRKVTFVTAGLSD